MSDDLIERLRERARNRVPEDNPLGMTPGDFLEGQAADALAAKDTALSEMRAERDEALLLRDGHYSMWESACSRATAAEAQLDRARKALEPMAKCYRHLQEHPGGLPNVTMLQWRLASEAYAALSQDEPADLGVGG